jgi:hypothetical protein
MHMPINWLLLVNRRCKNERTISSSSTSDVLLRRGRGSYNSLPEPMAQLTKLACTLDVYSNWKQILDPQRLGTVSAS